MEEKLIFKNILLVDHNIQESIRELRNDKKISKFFIIDNISEETHRDWINNKLKEKIDYAFVIFFEKNPIGLVYLRNIKSEIKAAEYGIFLKQNSNLERGIGTKATDMIINFGFSELRLEEIHLKVLENNNHAIKLYKKFNFIEDNRFIEFAEKEGKKIRIIKMILKNETK